MRSLFIDNHFIDLEGRAKSDAKEQSFLRELLFFFINIFVKLILWKIVFGTYTWKWLSMLHLHIYVFLYMYFSEELGCDLKRSKMSYM